MWGVKISILVIDERKKVWGCLGVKLISMHVYITTNILYSTLTPCKFLFPVCVYISHLSWSLWLGLLPSSFCQSLFPVSLKYVRTHTQTFFCLPPDNRQSFIQPLDPTDLWPLRPKYGTRTERLRSRICRQRLPTQTHAHTKVTEKGTHATLLCAVSQKWNALLQTLYEQRQHQKVNELMSNKMSVQMEL